ncbi:MAG TPA: class II aldolase/adducin family protein [Candidatus Omnitrophota bacterium]|nr:class II aldolase/adducin family protein [Candidatus Omnitrophota bacterium]
MNNEIIQTIKKNIVAIGRLLWEKELATALNGNISIRVDEEHFLLTASKTCLGLLNESRQQDVRFVQKAQACFTGG